MQYTHICTTVPRPFLEYIHRLGFLLALLLGKNHAGAPSLSPSTMCVTGRATRMYMYVHIVLWGECDYGNPSTMCVTGRATRMYMYVHIVLWGECDYGNPSTMCVTGRATRMYMYVHIVLWGECDYGSPASCVGDVMCALYIRLLQHSNCVVQVNCFYTCIIT